MSDMTYDEIVDYYNIFNDPQNCSATSSPPLVTSEKAPSEWNWRDHDGVSPVKDQGNCGSCWTFSTVGALESAHLLKYNKLQTYSEQQLVDCAGDFDNYGCNGGLPSHAFEYLHYFGGITTEADYPYYASDRKCEVTEEMAVLEVGSAHNITSGDEHELKEAVYHHGPVSVCFQVVDGFSDYTSGVYTSTTCKNGTGDVNHAVLAVGYGTDRATGMDYWLVKNSWSADWGDEGFFKIERGVNMCGIAMCNSFPDTVKEISDSFIQ